MTLPIIYLLATSPWAPAEWRINLNIGREPGTYMPEEWGASGARLVLPLDVRVESDRQEDETEPDFKGAFSLSVLEDPVFIGSKGEEVVYFEEPGAWKIGARRGKLGDASKLRFWVDLDQEDRDIAATRNDVTLPAERLYFIGNCWRESEFKRGLERFGPIQATAQAMQDAVDRQLSHETGDRRLDGRNPLDTAMASVDMAVLVAKRDESAIQLKEAERILPCREMSKPGAWPGASEKLVICPGKIGVKRKSGVLGSDELHIIGTWSAKPLEGISEVVLVEEEADVEEDIV